MLTRAIMTISGRVQGVFFRDEAQRKAYSLDLKGFARNEPDNGLRIEAEGPEEDVKKFVEWCRRGPALARVSDFSVDYSDELKDYPSFEML